VTLDIDAGGARARRIIAKRIEAEATPMSQTSTNEHAPEHV